MIGEKVSYVVKIFGIVQGIGYRPYIYKRANKLDIKGWVSNYGGTVIINVEGTREKVGTFLIDIIKKPPKLADIEKVEVHKEQINGYESFNIKKSIYSNIKLKYIMPDIATCDNCLKDISNKKSGRYRYAFTNCTLCGPRYSIIKSLPYDRCNTTMDKFFMCPVCHEEYKNVETRRFHAQPTCCENCGPTLVLTDNKGRVINCLDPINKCAGFIKKGKIIGIKGIGGFHIVCSALNTQAVKEIRKRKNRKEKPLALMMKDIEQVKKYCKVSINEEEILMNNRRPIVLLNKKNEEDEFIDVAPRVKKYGVMLPYTPIHHLLFKENIPPVIMTSGNISGSPIEYSNEGAIKNISKLVDFFLINNRDINTPVDDSVVKVIDEKLVISRLGRGYSPYCAYKKINHKILACGAEDKSTFSFSLDGMAYMSQYLGDLKELKSYKEYIKCMDNMKNIFGFQPDFIAFDMHPNYMSTNYGKKISKSKFKIQVQHHHAHMASCMLEHNIWDKVIGIVYDGTGLGNDGNIWGGEFFIGDRHRVNRVAHLRNTKIQGGDSSQRDIWKIGVSYLKSVENKELRNFGLERLESICKTTTDNTCTALDYNLNCYNTSSLGRLYDGISSILGIKENITYDAQGAIELESVLNPYIKESYNYLIENKNGMYILNYYPIIEDILMDIKHGKKISVISAKFHNTIINMTVDMTCQLREEFKINVVILSGGVFENIYLIKKIYILLKSKGFKVYFNEKIPINDSGISLGQVAVADEILNKKEI
ncbi:carbamoyltransferase HypF [Clostridium rectalis]|uniref:carbamoyltransferase HypF n=1 Tax=Clostridium rectalis TaxID=2040295 RepID=UPI000F6365F5|nr:carbamoyltransferase HypF [Clostridium rectalis]